MLSSWHRFHGHGSLRYLFKNGEASRSRYMTIKHVTNPRRKHSRFAVVISKKVHKSAVGRNRMRRRIYEIIRLNLPRIIRPSDIAVIVTSGEVLGMEADALKAQVEGQFREAGLYNQ